jgi:hypothetical protein
VARVHHAILERSTIVIAKIGICCHGCNEVAETATCCLTHHNRTVGLIEAEIDASSHVSLPAYDAYTFVYYGISNEASCRSATDSRCAVL